MADETYAYAKSSSVAGNGLFASKSLDAGELILSITRPLIEVVDGERLKDTCSNCFKWAEATSTGSLGGAGNAVIMRACTGCRVMHYCDKKCQSQAWKRYHKYECKLICFNPPRPPLPNAVRAAMMILLLRKKGDMSDETWASLTQLESHVGDIVGRDLLETMAHGAHQFSATQNDFSEGTVVEMFARILCNSLTLVTPMYDPVGIAFDPLASISNHSCDPNAVVVFDGPRLSFRSLKSIAKDEEVFTAYVDTTNPFPYRHHELRNRFHFNCHCSKCTEAPTEPEDLFLQDPSKLPKTEPYVTFSATDVGRVLFQNTEWANDPQFAIGTDIDSRRLAGIQGLAFHNLEVAKDESDPHIAIKTLEDTMKLCFHSGMWPVTRQPMPSLRQQLFVNMLSANNFIIAWCQGIKIYLLIDPYLYPQEFHPVRVVHAWTLVLLTLYVSGQQDDPAVQQMHGQGVDFGTIILGLLNHVSNNVENSHSKGSSFAETVRMMVPSILSDIFPQGPPPMAALNAALEQQWKCLSQMAMWLKV